MAVNQHRNVVRTKYVYHAYEPSDGSEFITLLMDDKVFQIPPHEPFEMTTDSNGRPLDYPAFYTFQMLMTFGPLYGLVEVEAEMTRTGVTLNLERAEKQASDNLLLNRYRHIEQWAVSQINERVKEGKPVLAPTGFVEESIKLLNIDLFSKYRLQPIGWDWRPDKSKAIDGVAASLPDMADSALVAGLQDQIQMLTADKAAMQSQLDDIQGMLGELLAKQA